MQRAILITAALGLGAIGCDQGDGLKRVQVRGKLTAKGAPVAHAAIQLLPLGETKGGGAVGGSDADGNFKLDSDRQHPGVVPGEYKVRISRLLARDGSVIMSHEQVIENPDPIESVPEKYARVESTPLKATVPETGAELTIDIPDKLLTGKERRR